MGSPQKRAARTRAAKATTAWSFGALVACALPEGAQLTERQLKDIAFLSMEGGLSVPHAADIVYNIPQE